MAKNVTNETAKNVTNETAKRTRNVIKWDVPYDNAVSICFDAMRKAVETDKVEVCRRKWLSLMREFTGMIKTRETKDVVNATDNFLLALQLAGIDTQDVETACNLLINLFK